MSLGFLNANETIKTLYALGVKFFLTKLYTREETIKTLYTSGVI